MDTSRLQLRRVQDLQFAVKLRELKEGIKPGYHCVCHLKVKKSGKQYLVLGGNHNKIFKYEIIQENSKKIDDLVYMGCTDFKVQQKDLPRQKINGIYQYRNTTLVVCVMSYGYVAVVDIDENGLGDKI